MKAKKGTAKQSPEPTTEPVGAIRVGIGGWTYEPWRGVFFPDGLPHDQELAFAASQLTSIEINGTYYRTQKPATFQKWASAAPNNFVFAVKALRYATNRKILAEAGESVTKFVGSGLVEMGAKLGPILWQFAPTKRFDPADFGAFLTLLPTSQDGVPLRHALEVRHESFRDAAFVELARRHGAAIVFADSAKYPAIADVTADFVYARLENCQEEIETGYSAEQLDQWADVCAKWACGSPAGLPESSEVKASARARDVFVYMISGAKVRAPAAAKALLGRVAGEGPPAS